MTKCHCDPAEEREPPLSTEEMRHIVVRLTMVELEQENKRLAEQEVAPEFSF